MELDRGLSLSFSFSFSSFFLLFFLSAFLSFLEVYKKFEFVDEAM
jgi:hypothetical protein